ncbi:hypothetical protein [Brevibacillus brevis]|uniref:Tetratricopeptide repeat protein n=1 Tax=Brevibacillus brevis TaxID=1393 RepID=A0ABY9T2T4_BREBE|nr:hypothetical protein [Brevibacillus brevis]WNC13536.1 hypothetical protein RGB73_23005 [Brevibacillus brevis]
MLWSATRKLELEWHETALDLLENEPPWAYGLFVLSKCRYAAGDYEEALRSYQEAIGPDPDLAEEDYH